MTKQPAPMTAAFTICSNNYLAHALTLAESMRRHAPTWRFFIGLVDTPQAIPGLIIHESITLIPCAQLGLVDLPEMALRYNIIELCTALKPTYFRKLFNDYPEIEQAHYLDPDTLLLNNPAVLDLPANRSVQMTPHQLTPIPLDGAFPDETLTLNHGIFNLGYLGLRRGDTTMTLLHWWEERLRNHCRIDLVNGLFVDQLWFNLVPIYFPAAHVLRHPGVNVAFWNLHERRVTADHNIIFAGETHPLVLFHFSGFSASRPDTITRVAVRHDSSHQPELRPLLTDYAQQLAHHGLSLVKSIESSHTAHRRHHQETLARDYARRHPWRQLLRWIKQSIPESLKRLLRS